jgi:hypothetical protein
MAVIAITARIPAPVGSLSAGGGTVTVVNSSLAVPIYARYFLAGIESGWAKAQRNGTVVLNYPATATVDLYAGGNCSPNVTVT